MPHEMLFEILLRGHTAPTDPADELRLVVAVLHVGLEGVQVLAEVAAHVTHDRRRTAMVLLHVMVQRFLDLELLAADIARVVVAAGVQSYVMILQGALIVALVIAHAALVHLLPMILLDVRDQVTLQSEGLRAVGALVPVLLQMLREIALLQKLAPTMVALHARRLPLDRSILLGCESRARRFRGYVRVYLF